MEGHVGHQCNELSDHYAKAGTLLVPPPQPLSPHRGMSSVKEKSPSPSTRLIIH